MDSTFLEFYDNLYNLKQNNKLCDGTIVSSGGETHSFHRIVFSDLSPVLQNMLVECGSGGDNGTSILHLPVDSTIVQKILDCAYFRDKSSPGYTNMEVTWANVETLCLTAESLKIKRLNSLCRRFLEKKLESGEKVCYILNLAKRFNMGVDLQDKIFKYILIHFESIKDKYLLYFEDMLALLSNDLLNVDVEDNLFFSINEWINHNTAEREVYRQSLCDCIRVDQLIDDGIQYNAIVSNMSRLNVDIGPRLPHELIIIYGGWHGTNPTSIFESYDPKADRWTQLAKDNPQIKRAYHGMVTLDNLIYFIGGMTVVDGKAQYFNDTRCYDPVTGVWTVKSYMHYPRCYVACCELDRKIYAMGGYSGYGNRLSSVERFDVTRNQWNLIPPMNEVRSDAGCCACGGKIFIAGGFTGEAILCSAEMFDPKTYQWTEIATMAVPRSGFILANFMDMGIFAIGGFDSLVRLSSVECYNLDEQMWKHVTNMHIGRSNFGACQINSKIYVFGGFDGTTTISGCEVYDVESNFWRQLSDLDPSRSAMGCTIIKNMSNVRELCGRMEVEE